MATDPEVVTRLKTLLTGLDAAGVDALLTELAPGSAERREVADWLGRSRTWSRRLHEQLFADHRGRGTEFTEEPAHDLGWLLGATVVAVLGPVSAAERLPWHLLWYDRPAGDLLRRRLREHDAAWIEAFAERASHLTGDRVGGGIYSTLLHDELVHHDLRCPTGTTFVSSRMWQPWGESLADTFAAEPLMPEVLYLALGAGLGGTIDRLPDELDEMLRRGLVDRGPLRDTCLEALTRATPVGSQRVLVKCLLAIGLTVDEVPGGLPYLLGVISTSTGAVGSALLPLALDLVTTAEELDEVVGTIAARPERKQKSMLLTWLGRPATTARLGAPTVTDGVRRLVEHDDDAAFRAKADKLLATLVPASADDATEPHAPVVLGLWDMRPAVEQPPAPWWRQEQPHWGSVLAQHVWGQPEVDAGAEAWLCDTTLAAMTAGTFDPAAMASSALDLVAAGKLVVARLTRMLDEIILAGGLSQVWQPALEIADLAVARRPAGLAGLLRMLASYAAECPPGGVPPRIAALAASNSSTKAAVEARLLVDRLGGPVTVPVDTGPEVRGLWRAPADPIEITGVGWPLLDGDPIDLEALTSVLSHTDGHDHAGARAGRFDWVMPALTLQAVVRSIDHHGVGPARDAVTTATAHRRSAAHVHTYAEGPFTMALEVWAAGLLSPQSHLALVEPRESTWDEWRSLHADDSSRLVAALRSGDVRMHGSPATRLHLLHATECLLLAPERLTVLSTPVLTDGTLWPHDLLDRLEQPGPVGPLDLLLALHRMIDVDQVDRDRLDRIDPDLTTDPRVSGGRPLPVAATVRRWIDAGGLGPLVSEPSYDEPWPRWRHHGRRPVPWSEVATAPAGLDDDVAAQMTGAQLRITPRWPEVVRARPLLSSENCTPEELSERLGLAGHGRPTADWLVGGLLGRHRYRHEDLVAVATTRMPPTWLPEGVLVESVLEHHRAATFTLTSATPVLETLFLGGAMQTWWHPALALADVACSATPRPTGLVKLLTMLADHVHEVPAPVALPDGVRAMAASKGSTRSHGEARRLVAGAGS